METLLNLHNAATEHFAKAYAAAALGATLVLVAAACAISPEASDRAQMIVTGCERIVFTLAAVAVARAVYSVGARIGQIQASLATA